MLVMYDNTTIKFNFDSSELKYGNWTKFWFKCLKYKCFYCIRYIYNGDQFLVMIVWPGPDQVVQLVPRARRLTDISVTL